MGQKDIYTCWYQPHHPFGGHCLLAMVRVQVVVLAVHGLLIVEEAASKRGSLAVLDFGPVSCHWC